MKGMQVPYVFWEAFRGNLLHKHQIYARKDHKK